MKNRKKIYLSLMLSAVLLMFSVVPSLAADVQAAYAKLSGDLLDAFDAAASGERLNVIVWLEDNTTEKYQAQVANMPVPEMQTVDVANLSVNELQNTQEEADAAKLAQIEQIQNYIMEKRLIAQAMYLAENNAVAAELESSIDGGEIVYISKYSPVIICNVSRSEALGVASESKVLSITNGEVELENCMDVSASSVGSTDLSNYGYTGQGINLGMIELANPDLTSSCYEGISDKITTYSFREDETITEDITHANIVATIMIEKSSGIAKGFSHLYTAEIDNGLSFYQGVEQLISSGVNVINMSFGLGRVSQYDTISLWIDHVAFNHSVHIVKSAGNNYNSNVSSADKVSCPGMSYNIITVGNTDDNDTVSPSDDILDISSVYNGSRNDIAYKPDLCAPGTKVDVPWIYGEENSAGTSISAPHVTGIIAQLCSYHPYLLTQPALMKSILLSSVSQNGRRYDTTDSKVLNYRKYGSGIVNAYNAKALIDSGNYVTANFSVNSEQHVYSLGTLQAGETISVTLAFLKYSNKTGSTHGMGDPLEMDLADLDLHIYKTSATDISNRKAYSITSNNNVEKIIYTATETAEYFVVVDKVSSEGPETSRYGLSWLKDSDNLQ